MASLLRMSSAVWATTTAVSTMFRGAGFRARTASRKLPQVATRWRHVNRRPQGAKSLCLAKQRPVVAAAHGQLGGGCERRLRVRPPGDGTTREPPISRRLPARKARRGGRAWRPVSGVLRRAKSQITIWSRVLPPAPRAAGPPGRRRAVVLSTRASPAPSGNPPKCTAGLDSERAFGYSDKYSPLWQVPHP